MKTKRGTRRSFPGRLTLEEWLALTHLRRVDLEHRAECERLGCLQLCARKPCKRHRTCCGDDAGACQRRLWHLTKSKPKTLWRELIRLSQLVALPAADHGPPWTDRQQRPAPKRGDSPAASPGQASRDSGRGSGRRPGSGSVRARSESSDAGLWEIIQTGYPEERR